MLVCDLTDMSTFITLRSWLQEFAEVCTMIVIIFLKQNLGSACCFKLGNQT